MGYSFSFSAAAKTRYAPTRNSDTAESTKRVVRTPKLHMHYELSIDIAALLAGILAPDRQGAREA
jgi:hypothetical protein